MPTEKIFTFIAIWNQDFGTKVIEVYPESEDLDFNRVAEHIFITYHNFYKKNKDGPSERTFFKLPLVNINKKAGVFLDAIIDIEDVSKLQSIIAVMLIPDFFPDDRIEVFDNIIQNIGMEYIETRTAILEKYHKEVNDLFILEQQVKDSEITIDENYGVANALDDFQNGLIQYQNKEFDRAYFLLRRSSMKFELENELKVLLETYFYIATILMQKYKFKSAKDFFKKLESLAEQLEHQKYYEKSIYMQGYCDYQLMDYNEAYANFSRLGKTSLAHVSKFQYLILLGKVLADVGHFDDAIKSLEKALEISESAKTQPDIIKKRAEIFLDLGHIYYEMAYRIIKSGIAKESEYEPDLLNSIKNFHEATLILKILDDYSRIIRVFEPIASNYEILGKMEEAIENYEKALDFAQLSNDVISRFKLLEKVIQIYTEQGLHELIVRKIDIILHEIAPVAYLDIRSVAGFHRRMGESFVELGIDNEALSELIVALNLYNKFSEVVPELGDVYNKLIEIYKKRNDPTHVDYYQDKLVLVQDQIEQAAKREKMEYKPLEVVEEFWFFTEDGTVIFSYTPKTNTTPRLLSNFLTAMDNFGSELELAQIKTIKIGLEYFSYYKEQGNPIFIVGRSDVKFDVEQIEKIIKAFFVKFFTNFEPLIKTFDGDTTKFNSFIKIIKDIEID